MGDETHLRSRKKDKGELGVERERGKEEGETMEKLEIFCGTIYNFLSNFKSFEATNLLYDNFPAVDTPSVIPTCVVIPLAASSCLSSFLAAHFITACRCYFAVYEFCFCWFCSGC